MAQSPISPMDAQTKELIAKGAKLAEDGHTAQAWEVLSEAIKKVPYAPEALFPFGRVAQRLRRLEVARRAYERVLEVNPKHGPSWYQLGSCAMKQGHPVQAIAFFDKAIALSPDNITAQVDWGLAHLQIGDYENGWEGYEKRRVLKDYPMPSQAPDWTGKPFKKKRLLICTEQGKGDAFMFARFFSQAKSLGGEVIFHTHDAMVPIMNRLTDPVTIAGFSDPIPEHDLKIPVTSLGRVLNIRVGTIPAEVPYMTAEPERAASWEARLKAVEADKGFAAKPLRIGLSWQGNKTAKIDEGRSYPLSTYDALKAIPGLHLISLQKNDGAEQIAEFGAALTAFDDLDENGGAFMDTAALMQSLDLVITSDTAIAHLAGALNRPVWVLLRHAADWRFLLHRSDSPWYPSMRLFRQTKPGDWTGPMAQIERILRKNLDALVS